MESLEEDKNEVKNTCTIDVAALCTEITKIEKMCDYEIIDLDDIPISIQAFKNIYYPYGETFGLEKKIASKEELSSYISFLPYDRTVNGENFYLLETIIRTLENTLNVSRNCFASDTMVALNKELGSLKTLCDLPCCSVLASLPWSILSDTMKTHRFLKKKDSGKLIFHCRVSIFFKTPTEGIPPIVIRFNYLLLE